MLPITEQDNPNTVNIDKVSTLEALRLINAEDKVVAEAVEKVLPEVARAVDEIARRCENGGRIFYIGTGTSGRLGVLDASEIPPTYGVSYDLVQGIIAGGYDALYKATESSEDNKDQGVEDLKERGLKAGDSVVGIAASGRTPYTIGAVEYAKSIGCFTACIVCNPGSLIAPKVDVAIVPVVGPEPITGSTRMKSGTAQKMVLNMISTCTMIRLGYVNGNRMTNMRSSNEKLKDRGVRILASETGLSNDAAQELLDSAGDLRVALVMNKASVTLETARDALERFDWKIDRAIADLSGASKG